MSQTFNDVILECLGYPYSAECYDLYKESQTICLMEKYIENQMFVENNSEIFENTDVNIEDGYFSESVNEETIQSITEEVEQKKQNFVKRIWEGFKKLVVRFAKFLARAASGCKYVTVSNENLEQKLKEKEYLLKSSLQKLASAQERIKASVIAIRESEAKSAQTIARLEKERDIALADVTRLGNDITAKQDAYDQLQKQSNETIKNMKTSIVVLTGQLKTANEKISELEGLLFRFKKEQAKIVNPIKLIKIMQDGKVAIEKADAGSIKTIDTEVTDDLENTRRFGMFLSFGKSRMENLSAALNKTASEMNNVTIPDNGNGEFATAAQALLTKLNECAGDTMSAVSAAIAYHNATVQCYDEIVKAS